MGPGHSDAQHSAAVLEFGLNLIHQRRAALEEARADGSLNPETEDSHPLTQDFLGQFMAHDGSISDEEIASAVNGIVFAAHDTTGCVLSFAIHALGRMPHLQDKIREEVLSVAGEEMVTLDDLPKLQYTQQFIQETMRMYPPVRAVEHVPFPCGGVDPRLELNTTPTPAPATHVHAIAHL